MHRRRGTTGRSMQLSGGDGVSHERPLARFLAEVRPFRIYDGPSETHRWAIARRASRVRARAREEFGPGRSGPAAERF